MSNLHQLRPREVVAFDDTPLWRLRAELGVPATEHILLRVLEVMSARIALLHGLAAEGRISDMQKPSRGLAGIASEIGMRGVARVCRQLNDAASQNNSAAACATLARLDRVVDASVAQVWDLQDMMI